jgi:PAS domain S-box-containing protein
LVGLAYYLGAEAAFAIGTLTQMFAPFWPPNVVLLCALLCTAERRWWLYVLAVFPAHIAAEWGVAMPLPQLLMAFACNVAVALLNAVGLRRMSLGPPWLSNLRDASWYLLITAVLGPGLAAFGGGVEPTFGSGDLSQYWGYYWRWYVSNALGSLTLTPVFLTCFAERPVWFAYKPLRRWIEAAALALGLVAVCAIAFGTPTERASADRLLPALLYAPIPLLLWAAVRFGRRGASGAILIVTVLSLWQAMQGEGPFAATAPGDSVLALQLFLAVISVPAILLAAVVEELHGAEADYRALYNNAPAPQHALDIHGNLIGVSDYWLELMGYARSEVVGMPVTAYLRPASAERCRQGWSEFLAHGDKTVQEFEFVKRSGETVEALVSRRVERDPAGHIVRTLGVLTDVTARRKAERERDRLFEIAQDLIIIAGFDGTFRDANPAFERVLGYRRDEILGMPYIDLVHPEDRAKAFSRFERLTNGEHLAPNEVRCRHRDGSWRWISWRPMTVREERLLYAVGRDTTESRQTEAALRQAQKMEAVGLLTGGIAHDFNNLLTVIIGNLDLLRPQIARQPRLARLVKAMQHGAERGERLIRDLLAFSRQQTLHPETIDINALIRHFEPLIRRAVGETIEIRIQLQPTPCPCTIDPAQLEVALLNLSMNGRDAMPAGGRLTIETANLQGLPEPLARSAGTKPGPFVMLAVHDTGTGMPPELVERAFEPFFTTKDAGKGSGLGLSQVHGFVNQSGGYVTINSEIGQGTTVRLLLPRAKAEPIAVPPMRPVGPDAKTRRGLGRILVVEDDISVLDTSTAMMTDLGYEVLTTAGPLEALKVLQDDNQQIDLLFSDVMMPVMSGVKLAEEAKKLRPGLKVLLTTGYSKESLAVEEALTELPLMAKPFRRATLAMQLRALFDA